MPQTITRILLFSLLLAAPAAVAQNNGPGPGESSSKRPDQAPPAPTTTAPPVDSAEKDLDVASFYMRKGDPDGAIPRLKEAIELKPNWGEPRLLLAKAYEKKHDNSDAVKCYQGYLQVFPKAPDAEKIRKKIEKLSG
jgi:tetratricopeptide (TPR) repeat protein